MSNSLSPKLNEMGRFLEKHDISKETQGGDNSIWPISIEEIEATGNNLPKTNKQTIKQAQMVSL